MYCNVTDTDFAILRLLLLMQLEASFWCNTSQKPTGNCIFKGDTMWQWQNFCNNCQLLQLPAGWNITAGCDITCRATVGACVPVAAAVKTECRQYFHCYSHWICLLIRCTSSAWPFIITGTEQDLLLCSEPLIPCSASSTCSDCALMASFRQICSMMKSQTQGQKCFTT